jgi:potassium/hydrogen antiporter
MESLELSLLVGATLVVLSIVVSPLANRFGAPILLVFLAIGMLVGQDGPGGVEFDDFNIAYEVGSIALAVILFSGGLGTSVAAVKKCWSPAVVLATFGVLLTAGVVGLGVWLLGEPLLTALLLGSVIGSTDAAATFLLLRNRGVQLRGRVMETIVVESGLNDPMAIFLTIVFVGLVDSGADRVSWDLLRTFVMQLGIGAVAGIVGGLGLARLLNRLPLEAGLYAVLAMAGALVLFVGVQLLGGSGYLTVYLAGIVLMHSLRDVKRTELEHTHNSLAWLSQIIMFLMLGLLVNPSELGAEAAGAGIVALLLMFVARPIAITICLAPFRFSWRERLFIAWVGLRGAVPIFLAIIPVISSGPIEVPFFNIVFIVVVASLACQGWTIPWLARRLKLVVPS